MTKAVIWYNGVVLWQPPATYKDPTSKIVPEKHLIDPEKTSNGPWKDCKHSQGPEKINVPLKHPSHSHKDPTRKIVPEKKH